MINLLHLEQLDLEAQNGAGRDGTRALGSIREVRGNGEDGAAANLHHLKPFLPGRDSGGDQRGERAGAHLAIARPH
eukprot:scaffold42802_cov31-Tisochrysis_lutea.AAC.3